MPKLRSIAALAASLVVATLVAAAPAAAHVSPPGCTSNRLVAAIAGAPSAGRNGDEIALTASVGNLGEGACDVTDATVTLRLPSADGTPGTGQAVPLGTGLSLPAGQMLTARPAVPYTIAFDEGTFRSEATVAIAGVLHDGLGNSAAAYAHAVDVVISRPHVSFSVAPSPAAGFAPLPVTYRYVATNDSPPDPAPGAVQPGVANPAVADDGCGPLTPTGGDSDGDAVLERGEAWSYACSTVFAAGTFVHTATFSGTSDLDGRPWPVATARATVTATTPVVPPPLDRTRPRLTMRALSPTSFRPRRSGPPIVAGQRTRGTRVAFSVSERSAVRFTVDRRRRGRKVGNRCMPPRRANRTRARCARWVRIRASFRLPAAPGDRAFRFSGRIGGKRLAPGRYRLLGIATDPAGNRSAAVARRFRIIR